MDRERVTVWSPEYRDLWIVRLAVDGRCRFFEEWPFGPGRPTAAPS